MDDEIEVVADVEMINDILDVLQEKHADKNGLTVLLSLHALTQSVSEELGIPVSVFGEQ